ncbi:MAG: sugar phosphate isomerase/epimerase family protein [Phycisphaerae bacterium]
MPWLERLAFSTNAFKQTDVLGAVEAIARAGYAGVEVMADAPHLVPLDGDDPLIDAVTARAGILKTGIANVNAFTGFCHAKTGVGDTYHPTWIEEDAALRDLRVNHTLAAVEMAARLGARTVSLQPGGPTIGTNLDWQTAAGRFAEGLSRVLPTAKRLGVTLAVEPEPGLFIQTAGEYARFKQEHFPHEDHVRMNLDIGHLFCVGDDVPGVIRSMAAEVAHVHLEDIKSNRVHQHHVPGDGAIDFPAIFAALSDVQYAGWVTVELYPYENNAAGVAQRAIEHLRTLPGVG